jgi:hypothetical protein
MACLRPRTGGRSNDDEGIERARTASGRIVSDETGCRHSNNSTRYELKCLPSVPASLGWAGSKQIDHPSVSTSLARQSRSDHG